MKVIKYIEEPENLTKYYEEYPCEDGIIFYKKDEPECLILGSRQLTGILSLPNMVTHLYIQNNNLTELCELPLSLTHFNCSNNMLTYLPNLPEALVSMDCSENYIKKLPKIPVSLKHFNCCHNELTEFPEIPINSHLTILDCSRNNITEVKNLILNCPLLREFNCNHNKITSLCDLPSNIFELKCCDNLLVSLPPLDKLTNLTILNCGYNQLTSFSSHLPEKLSILYCRNNALTYLPPLKKAYVLDCVNNQLHYLPDLSRVKTLEWHFNPLYPYLFRIITANTKKNINLMFRLRTLFYTMKCKKRLTKFLWEKVRRPKIEAFYHPDKLVALLQNIDNDDEYAFDNVISAW